MKVHNPLITEVGKSFGPETLKVMGDAFESAWAEVAHQFASCDVRAAQRARRVVAEGIIAQATDRGRDVGQLRHAGLRALFLQYPWLFDDHRKQA